MGGNGGGHGLDSRQLRTNLQTLAYLPYPAPSGRNNSPGHGLSHFAESVEHHFDLGRARVERQRGYAHRPRHGVGFHDRRHGLHAHGVHGLLRDRLRDAEAEVTRGEPRPLFPAEKGRAPLGFVHCDEGNCRELVLGRFDFRHVMISTK